MATPSVAEKRVSQVGVTQTRRRLDKVRSGERDGGEPSFGRAVRKVHPRIPDRDASIRSEREGPPRARDGREQTRSRARRKVAREHAVERGPEKSVSSDRCPVRLVQVLLQLRRSAGASGQRALHDRGLPVVRGHDARPVHAIGVHAESAWCDQSGRDDLRASCAVRQRAGLEHACPRESRQRGGQGSS